MGERTKTYNQKMRDLEDRDSGNPMFQILFTAILSGGGRDRIEKRILQDGKETLQIEFGVTLTYDELKILRGIDPSTIKEYLETKFRSDEIGKSYPGIDKITYSEMKGPYVGIRIVLMFEGTPIPE